MNPQVKEYDHRWVQFIAPFTIHSEKLDRDITIPSGFVCDRESVPIIKGTSIRGGYVHDYLYRYDSDPIVSRSVADAVYYEIMTQRGNSMWRRAFKWAGVRCFGFFAYHKHSVKATIEELRK